MMTAATAAERVTFKMSVDKMVPFRYVIIVLILGLSTTVYGVITHIKQGLTVSFHAFDSLDTYL